MNTIVLYTNLFFGCHFSLFLYNIKKSCCIKILKKRKTRLLSWSATLRVEPTCAAVRTSYVRRYWYNTGTSLRLEGKKILTKNYYLFNKKKTYSMTQSQSSAPSAIAVPSPNPTLYIANIDWSIKKKLLRKSLYYLFSRHGKVLDVIALRAVSQHY